MSADTMVDHYNVILDNWNSWQKSEQFPDNFRFIHSPLFTASSELSIYSYTFNKVLLIIIFIRRVF